MNQNFRAAARKANSIRPRMVSGKDRIGVDMIGEEDQARFHGQCFQVLDQVDQVHRTMFFIDDEEIGNGMFTG
ncbi:hypothetical protein AB4Y85_00155 [Microvirga sp. 2YAF29]|uniref:hypothetical protein n=1 Tax=Microvirga sp. 2YAF29 TaxID=3233031 RepID=UPI003F962B60